MDRPVLAIVHCASSGQPPHIFFERRCPEGGDRAGVLGWAGHGVLAVVDGEAVQGEPVGDGRQYRLGFDRSVVAGLPVGLAGLAAAVGRVPVDLQPAPYARLAVPVLVSAICAVAGWKRSRFAMVAMAVVDGPTRTFPRPERTPQSTFLPKSRTLAQCTRAAAQLGIDLRWGVSTDRQPPTPPTAGDRVQPVGCEPAPLWPRTARLSCRRRHAQVGLSTVDGYAVAK
jgi:hypothetical protein